MTEEGELLAARRKRLDREEEPVTRFTHRGMRVVHQHVPGSLTAVALSVRAGARFDGRHPGIAHVAEHMLFQGTASLDQLALNRRAAELGGEHTADTGYETISLTIEVFNEDITEALDLLAEQFYHSQVNEERFRKERRVVLDEVRGRLDDRIDRLHRRAWAHFFDGAIRNPVWGSIKSLNEMRARHVASFLRRQFTHDRTVLAIVGGVAEDEARRAIRQRFRGRTATNRAPVPRVRPGRTGTLRVKGGSGQVGVVKMMAVPPQPKALLAAGLALDIVGSDPDSRMYQEIRERLGLSYEVSASLEWGPDWAVASIFASGGRGAEQRLARAIEETCRRSVEQGFAEDELFRGRRKVRYRYASLAESRLDRALALAEGAMSGFPVPEEAERLVARMPARKVEETWRRMLTGRSLTAILVP